MAKAFLSKAFGILRTFGALGAILSSVRTKGHDMAEITCPSCGSPIPIDESTYTALLSQVRDDAFRKELDEREAAERQKHEALLAETTEKLKRESAEEIASLRARLEAEEAKAKTAAEQAEKDRKREEEASKRELEAAVEKQKLDAETEIARLKAELTAAQEKAESDKALALAKQEQDSDKRIAALEAELREEKTKAQSFAERAESEKKLAVSETKAQVERERDRLASEMALEKEKAERSRAEFEAELSRAAAASKELIKAKDEEIERLRDMKARLSTKMIGETLEQHCETEFNKIRAYAFPHATFGKDNTVVEGTKGDYVFREEDENGTELLSIMFEMKNEADTTATKHKNADFFAKLDKDRTKKNCEYAILVSLLEPENDFYNQGIVEVVGFEKMYVIRPQFFVPIIGLLRNMALRSQAARQEVELLRDRDRDLTDFEDNLEEFKTSIMATVARADKSLGDSVAAIDKAIKDLEKAKERLQTTRKHLGTTDNKAQKLTIRKLTAGNKTIKEKLEEARKLAAAGGEPEIEILAPEPQDAQAAELGVESIEIVDAESSEAMPADE